MKTAVIGVGLIGGSFALSLRQHGLSNEIWGVENSHKHAVKALELGLVDKIVTIEEAIEWAEFIVIATPVDYIPVLAVKLLNQASNKQIVIDMGSIKSELSEVISQHPNRARFVATHPMWGTEYSGPEAATKNAFTGRTVVICDKELSSPDALDVVERVYDTLGMVRVYMSSEEQDMHSAYISHISHITSFALALTVLEKEREEEHIFDLAGGGFESTVRLAKSSPQTWVPILLQNRYNVLDVLREHIHQLQIFRKMLEKGDKQGLVSAIEKANRIEKIIK